MPDKSCLVSRLSRFVDLSEGEMAFVARMERNERFVSSGQALHEIGDPVQNLYVLKYGWAVVRSAEVRGRSQILRIYLPGEVIGLAEVGRGEALHRLVMQTDGTVCPFPRTAIAEMFKEAPRLSALLTSISSLDQLSLRQRVVALSRMTAEHRMIEFLITLRDRLDIARVGNNNRFQLPFSQSEIGDFLGLTPVYVNKLMRKLREEGRIEVDRPYVRILDREGMERQVGYSRIFDSIDTSWFPPAAA
ncbi:Crp/Fnr family transcriptional regulator [Rhodobacteraceae bacterium CCMM004]|nr:Crp/Fnr family transcriptional regulator [Rhodobacteraceae bacterium CCMM004]